jgi:hypothetical protein
MGKIYERRLRSFAYGLVRASQIIEEKQPDIIVAPMRGAVPLIDGINVVNPYFDNSIVYYIPASSCIKNVKKIFSETLANILLEIFSIRSLLYRENPFLMLSIDEVVSGNSAIRTIKAVEEGIRIFSSQISERILSSDFLVSLVSPVETTEKKNLLLRFIKSKIKYEAICFEHEYFIKKGGKRHLGYNKMVENGTVVPIPVEFILTMDRPSLCPVSYIRSKTTKWFLPVIDKTFRITDEYLSLLADIASIVGTDPYAVHPSNLKRIFEHQEFIPEQYKEEHDDSPHPLLHASPS